MALALALSVAPSASALTLEEAQTYYLVQVCAPNPAIDRLNRAIFRGHATVRPRQMHGKRLRQTRRALLIVRIVELRAGQALITPPSDWPSPEAAAATTQVGRALVRDSQLMLHLRRLAGRRFLRFWSRVVVPHGQLLNRLDGVASESLTIPPDATC